MQEGDHLDYQSLDQYIRDNKLPLKTTKTNAIYISNAYSVSNVVPGVIIDSPEIEMVYLLKMVGITFASKSNGMLLNSVALLPLSIN